MLCIPTENITMPQKLRYGITIQSNNHTFGYITEAKAGSQRDIFTLLLIALFAIAKRSIQPKCLRINEQTKCSKYIQ